MGTEVILDQKSLSKKESKKETRKASLTRQHLS